MPATDLPMAQAKSKPADVSERGLVSSSGAPVPLLSMRVRGEILDLAAQVGYAEDAAACVALVLLTTPCHRAGCHCARVPQQLQSCH